MLKDKLKRLTASLLSAAMVLTGTFTGFSLPSVTAQAASVNIPKDFNEQLVADAAMYLGYGYKLGGLNTTTGYFDCSGLVYQVLDDMGFTGMPTATGAAEYDKNKTYTSLSGISSDGWIYKIINETLELTYNGVTYSKANGNMVYVTSASAYQTALNDSANKGKIVICKGVKSTTNPRAAIEYNAIYRNITPGTIMLFPDELLSDGHVSAAHMAIAATRITPTGMYKTSDILPLDRIKKTSSKKVFY